MLLMLNESQLSADIFSVISCLIKQRFSSWNSWLLKSLCNSEFASVHVKCKIDKKYTVAIKNEQMNKMWFNYNLSINFSNRARYHSLLMLPFPSPPLSPLPLSLSLSLCSSLSPCSFKSSSKESLGLFLLVLLPRTSSAEEVEAGELTTPPVVADVYSATTRGDWWSAAPGVKYPWHHTTARCQQ